MPRLDPLLMAHSWTLAWSLEAESVEQEAEGKAYGQDDDEADDDG